MPMKKLINVFIAVLLLQSCATYKPQSAKSAFNSAAKNKEIEHSFYIIGNTGLPENNQNGTILPKLSSILEEVNPKSTLLFLGNSILDSNLDSTLLTSESSVLKTFKGNTIFIPGELELSNSIDALRDIEKKVDNQFGKNTFLPERGCPIEEVEISDNVVLILVDSQWYLSDWNKYPKINEIPSYDATR